MIWFNWSFCPNPVIEFPALRGTAADWFSLTSYTYPGSGVHAGQWFDAPSLRSGLLIKDASRYPLIILFVPVGVFIRKEYRPKEKTEKNTKNNKDTENPGELFIHRSLYATHTDKDSGPAILKPPGRHDLPEPEYKHYFLGIFPLTNTYKKKVITAADNTYTGQSCTIFPVMRFSRVKRSITYTSPLQIHHVVMIIQRQK